MNVQIEICVSFDILYRRDRPFSLIDCEKKANSKKNLNEISMQMRKKENLLAKKTL